MNKQIYYAPHPHIKKEDRESCLHDITDIPSNALLRNVQDDEIIIEFDEPITRDEAILACNEIYTRLSVERYYIEYYDHNGKSPHLHVKEILGLEALSHEQRKSYRLNFYDKYVPKMYRSYLDTSFTDKFRWVALENKQHYKGDKDGICRGVKTLIKATTSKINQMENELFILNTIESNNNSNKDYSSTINLLTPYWVEGKRDKLVLSLSGLFRKQGKGTNTIKHIISLICDITNDSEKDSRLKVVENTFRKDESEIKGLAGLKELGLPNDIIEQLTLESMSVTNSSDIVVKSLQEYMEKGIPDIEWLIENFLPVGGVFMLAADAGAFKSSIAISSAIACHDGGLFLGQFKTIKCNVLYVDEENGATILTKFGKVVKGLNSQETYSRIYITIFPGIRIDRPDSVVILNKLIEEYDIGLVILDSMVRFMVGDEDKATDVRCVLENTKLIRAKHPRLGFFILHHMTKGGKGLRGMRGSGDFGALADTVVTLDFKKGTTYVTGEFVKTRYLDLNKYGKFRINVIDINEGILFKVTDWGSEQYAYVNVIESCKKDLVRYLSRGAIREFNSPAVLEEMKSLNHAKNSFHSAINKLVLDGVLKMKKKGEYCVDLDKLAFMEMSL